LPKLIQARQEKIFAFTFDHKPTKKNRLQIRKTLKKLS